MTNLQSHVNGCDCATCAGLAAKTVATDDWLAQHRNHGDLSTEPFDHPSGRWYWLVCECGAKHLTTDEDG